jgi:GH15 family glucan-1,4-alpha-glucosidase
VARIEDYAMIGDLQTAALVDRTGSIDWLCLPRFDSAACFAALLGDEDNGYWRLAPTGGDAATSRSYRPGTLVLDTVWDVPEGKVRVTDFMPLRGQAPDIVRIVEGLRGSVEMRSELALRCDYGHVVPWVRHVDGSQLPVDGPDAFWLRTPIPTHGENHRSISTFRVSRGDQVPFVLTWQASHLPAPEPVDPEHALEKTTRFWKDWSDRASLPDRWAAPVERSLVTLKALIYGPTGGIVAAATTSLPEELGGARNWDYRYCWLRDAGYTLQTLLDAGFPGEARAWREWLLRAVAGDPQDLQVLYGITGVRRLPEWEVPWLGGYEGSKPVRLGNAASGQFQLDVYGEVLDTLALSRDAGLAPDEDAWDMQEAILDFLEGHWDDPDNGVWEVRGAPRQFVHSKVMAWAGFDRAVKAVEVTGLPGPVDRWRQLRAQVHEEVCAQGFDADRQTFTQFYGSHGLDAALLLLPQVGFLPASDPRIRGTVHAVGRELLRDGFLLRYDAEADSSGGGDVDGMQGHEGAFLACTFWYADALAMIGERQAAEETFERLLALRNDVGLLSEEYDTKAQRLLGNVPQAYSHVFLCRTARRLSAPATSAENTNSPGKAPS